MNKNFWQNIVITSIIIAIYVDKNTQTVHRNRPSHGLVFNSSEEEKEYTFSDGTVLKFKKGDLLYLPEGSSYTVKSSRGNCYAINFKVLSGVDAPFSIALRNPRVFREDFETAVRLFQRAQPEAELRIRSVLYRIIASLSEEMRRSYVPTARHALLENAILHMENDYTSPTLRISTLASEAGVSEVYFRRCFTEIMGQSPKKYLGQLRIARAKRLLTEDLLSVSEIAALSGYLEEGYFSKEFRRYTGLSPSEFRKEQKEGGIS